MGTCHRRKKRPRSGEPPGCAARLPLPGWLMAGYSATSGCCRPQRRCAGSTGVDNWKESCRIQRCYPRGRLSPPAHRSQRGPQALAYLRIQQSIGLVHGLDDVKRPQRRHLAVGSPPRGRWFCHRYRTAHRRGLRLRSAHFDSRSPVSCAQRNRCSYPLAPS